MNLSPCDLWMPQTTMNMSPVDYAIFETQSKNLFRILEAMRMPADKGTKESIIFGTALMEAIMLEREMRGKFGNDPLNELFKIIMLSNLILEEIKTAWCISQKIFPPTSTPVTIQ